MKRIHKILLCGFLLTLVFSFLGFDASSSAVSKKTLRLHVLANSDSEYDQRVKLTVKDTVSQLTEAILMQTQSKADAQTAMQENLVILEEAANQQLAALHTNYKAKAYVETCYFPTREYQEFTLPAGEYQALRVILGQGEGQNWWCVVYPALCATASTKSFDAFTSEEQRLMKGEHKISFQLYEWYQALVCFLRG